MSLCLVRQRSNGEIHIQVKKGNMRDGANLNQLLVLANMESYNAVLIDQDKPQSERLVLLRDLAVKQMQTLVSLDSSQIRALPGGEK